MELTTVKIDKPADIPKIREIIGLLPENVGLYEDLSAYKNLDFYGKIYKLTEQQRKERIQRYLTMLGLWEKRDRPVGSFSKGMKQKLAIARALIHEPQVIFMDEPTVNLDPEASKTVRDFILQLKKEKKTIFLNTHNLDEAQRICDKVAIMNTRLRAIGTPQELEKSVSGRKTVIGLEQQANDVVLEALKKLPLKNLSSEGNTITFDVDDPDRENSPVVEAIVQAGGHIRSINVVGSTLEDTYLKLVRK